MLWLTHLFCRVSDETNATCTEASFPTNCSATNVRPYIRFSIFVSVRVIGLNVQCSDSDCCFNCSRTLLTAFLRLDVEFQAPFWTLLKRRGILRNHLFLQNPTRKLTHLTQLLYSRKVTAFGCGKWRRVLAGML